MSDPLGLIGSSGGIRPDPQPAQHGQRGPAGGPAFKDVLIDNLNQVNKLSQDATRAVEDLATGDRTDVEGVILATQKADNAFRMLQAVRNKVMEAYDQVQQMRV